MIQKWCCIVCDYCGEVIQYVETDSKEHAIRQAKEWGELITSGRRAQHQFCSSTCKFKYNRRKDGEMSSCSKD